MKLVKRLAAIGSAVAVVACVMQPAAAASYTFVQSGYSGGGTVTGALSGVDGNSDGFLTTLGPGGEVSAWVLSFGGDAQVGAFSLGLAELQGLGWRLDGGPLGDDATPPGEGLSAGSAAYQLLAGLSALGAAGGLVADLQTGASSMTEQPIVLSLVPEPATALLLGAGLLGLCRRRSTGIDPGRRSRA